MLQIAVDPDRVARYGIKAAEAAHQHREGERQEGRQWTAREGEEAPPARRVRVQGQGRAQAGRGTREAQEAQGFAEEAQMLAEKL